MSVRHGLASIGLCACLGAALLGHTQAPSSKPAQKEPVLTRHATGTFEVKTTPLPADDATAGTAIGRYGIDKQFHGDLEGVSKGEMLGAGSQAKGTAGYVAIEQVTGTLHGHSGSFALQHFGAMDGGKFNLNVVVVPGSGAGDLAGIVGTMKIIIANGKHSYEFEYTLPEPSK
jgi:hypothetical protein